MSCWFLFYDLNFGEKVFFGELLERIFWKIAKIELRTIQGSLTNEIN